MADRCRIVSIPDDGRRPTVIRDFADLTTYAPVRDSFKIQPAPPNQILASADRRFGGSRIVGEAHDNGVLTFNTMITAATADGATAAMESMIGALSDTTLNRYLEWRPDGASRSVYYELLGPAPFDPIYRWIEFIQGSHKLEVQASCQVAPLAQGDCMDIWDDLTVDASADWTADVGTLVYAGGNSYTLNGTIASHTARGYTYGDVQVVAQLKVGTGAAAVLASYIDSNNHILAQLNGTSLQVWKRDGGVYTALGTPTTVTAPAAGTNIWLVLREEGNNVIAEYWTTPPKPYTAPASSQSVVLGAADATKFGYKTSGRAGIYAASTGWSLMDFKVKPFTYARRGLPDTINAAGPIPGTAPAKAAVELGSGNSLGAVPFGLLAWNSPPPISNLLPWGDANESVNGVLLSSALANPPTYTNAGAVILGGNTSAQVFQQPGIQTSIGIAFTTTNTSQLEGIGWYLPYRFRAGVQYTFEFYMAAASSTATMLAFFGSVASGSDSQQVAGLALTSTPTKRTITWTPQQDRQGALVGLATSPAAAIASPGAVISAAQVYEGTVAPAMPSLRRQGAGAFPVGVTSLSAAGVAAVSGWTSSVLQSRTDVRGGSVLSLVASAALGSGPTVSWPIDPRLYAPDEFTGTLDLEVWVRHSTQSTLNGIAMNASVTAEWFTGRRYTPEWGTSGAPLYTSPGGQTYTRWTRLGTLQVPVDPANTARWLVNLQPVTPSALSGTLLLYDAVVVPVRRRACSPSAKPATSGYPAFMVNGADVTKRVNWDLSGRVSAYDTAGWASDTGLGGQLIEVPPSAQGVDLHAMVSNLVPDDITLNAAGANFFGDGTNGGVINQTVHLSVTPRYFAVR